MTVFICVWNLKNSVSCNNFLNCPSTKKISFWNQCLYKFITRIFNDINVALKNLKEFEVYSWNTCIFRIDAYFLPGPVLLSQCWWPAYGIGKVFLCFCFNKLSILCQILIVWHHLFILCCNLFRRLSNKRKSSCQSINFHTPL